MKLKELLAILPNDFLIQIRRAFSGSGGDATMYFYGRVDEVPYDFKYLNATICYYTYSANDQGGDGPFKEFHHLDIPVGDDWWISDEPSNIIFETPQDDEVKE